jgi:hypothetical protein
MEKLTELEERICTLFSSYNIFSPSEIKKAYKKLRSFDELRKAIDRAALYNRSLVNYNDDRKEK